MKKKLFSLSLFMFTMFSVFAQSADRTISIDMNKSKGELNHFFNECVGAGRANEGLRADWQRQLRYTKEKLGFRYIRMHGLLHDDMGVYFQDRKGNITYNWQYIDELYDFLISIQVRPFVEFGFMPNALSSGKNLVFWWKANITPPKDYNKWGNLIKALVQHWTQRYGQDEVKRWYFEAWNEPNVSAFWTGTQDEYFHLYEVTANAVKSVSTDYRVGGPASAQCGWIPEFINFCEQKKVPVDFVSTHTYGIDYGAFDSGELVTSLSKRKNSLNETVIQTKKQILESKLPNLDLHYTEWGSSWAPTDPFHDSYQQSAYILEKLKKIGNAAKSMSYWTFTDIFEEGGPAKLPFYGGFGLINLQGINKPAFYAYEFLNRLGNTELQNVDSTSWACKDNNGNVQVLLWNFINTLPSDSIADQVYFKKEIPSKSIGQVTINLKNLPAAKYKLNLYKTGYRVNDAYTTYLDLGSPKQLTREQVQEIKQKNNGEPVLSKIINIGADKSFKQSFDFRENDVLFVTLTKL